MSNIDELWLTGTVQNQFVLFFGGFLAVTFFAALLLAYTKRRTSPCVVPLSNPRENDEIKEYIVVVYTSIWPGSRCPPSTSVYAKLNGSFHESGSVLLKKQKSNRQIFTRGSMDIFVLHTNEILGNLKSLELELKNSHGVASDWKPQKFEIYNFDLRQRWVADIIPSLICQKHLKKTLKISKTPIKIPRWKRYIMNLLGYHYWFFHLANPHSYGFFSTPVKTLLTFFTEMSLLFSNIMCYIVYHEPGGIMSLSAPVYAGSLLALFSSTIIILSIEYILINIRPTFQRRYLGLPKTSAFNDTMDRLKNLDIYWEGSNASSSSDDGSDIRISGPIAEIRKEKAAIKSKEASENKKDMAKNGKRASSLRNRRQYLEKRDVDTITDPKDLENRQKNQTRLPSDSFEGSRKPVVRFASNVNKSNPQLEMSCGQHFDYFQKETDSVTVDLTPSAVKNLWFEGRRSSKRLPGEHMKIYTDAKDVWETSSSRTSLLTIDSVQNSSNDPWDTQLELCEQGLGTQNETNLNFSSSTETGAKFHLLDSTRKLALCTWNMISNADIKKLWFEGRTSDKPAQGEDMHIYKTYSEDWDTKSSRSSLSEISDVPQHIIDSLRPRIDNFDLTPSESLTFKSESDTSINLTNNIEMQHGSFKDQIKTVTSYKSKRPRKRRTENEKQNSASQSLTSSNNPQIRSSLSALALQYHKQEVPVVNVSRTEDDDDDDGSVRFIYNRKKKTFFDVLSLSKIPDDSQKIGQSPPDNAEIPTKEITSLLRRMSHRSLDSASSCKVQSSTDIKGSMTKSHPKSFKASLTTLPPIQEFDPDTRPKVISFNVKPKIQGSSPKSTGKNELSAQGIASEAASDVGSVASQVTTSITQPSSSTSLATAAFLGSASVTETKIFSPRASSVNVSKPSQVVATKASQVYSPTDSSNVVSVASSDNTISCSSDRESASSETLFKSFTILDIDEDGPRLELELENHFDEFMTILDDPYSDKAIDLFLGTKKHMPDILETVSYCAAFKSQSESSIDPSTSSVLSPSTCSSATTLRENHYRTKDRETSSSMEMLENIAEAVSRHMPRSSRSSSTVLGILSLQDNTSSDLHRLASESSSHTTLTDPYMLRPIYPSEYKITDSDFLSKCQFSWLTSITDMDNNFNFIKTILLDIDSLMINEQAWSSLGNKTHAWCVILCRRLWSQIQTHMLDSDFVIRQDIRLKRIQNQEKEENSTQVVSGSSSSEIDLKTLLSATAVSDESERSEIRCVLLKKETDYYCDCGRTVCNQLQNIYTDMLSLASSILSQTVSKLYRMISQSERVSQEALVDLCNSINGSIKSTAYDLAAVAVEPDLITCYEDLWSFAVDPGYEVLASVIIYKCLRQGAIIYDYEWHLDKRAFFLVTEVIDAAVEDVNCELYEDTVIAKLCQDAINEATKEVLQDFADPCYIFTQHAIKHKLIHITKEAVRSKHRLSFLEGVVKLLASLWRIEGLDLSVNFTSRLVEALIIRIFRELQDTGIFSNLVQLKEIEQKINRLVRTAILCAANSLLVCIETGESLKQSYLRGIIEQTVGSNSKVKSKEKQGILKPSGKTRKQKNNLPNVQKDRRLSGQYTPEKGLGISSTSKLAHVLAEEINLNIDVASTTVYNYLVDQSPIIFDEYAVDLEISSMVDHIILKARNSLIADQMKTMATEEKAERSNLLPNDKFEPSDMYLKMKSCLISYDVIMDAQMSLIEESIGDPFTLDSKEIYDLRKELGPLKLYSKFVEKDVQIRNKQEMVKELKRYFKRHRDYVTINLQNIADAQCITSSIPNYDDRELYLLEWYLTGQLHKRFSPAFKVPLVVLMFLFTIFCIVFISFKGAELTIIQCQEWICLYFLTSFIFACIITPVKALFITCFQPDVEPFLLNWK